MSSSKKKKTKKSLNLFSRFSGADVVAGGRQSLVVEGKKRFPDGRFAPLNQHEIISQGGPATTKEEQGRVVNDASSKVYAVTSTD